VGVLAPFGSAASNGEDAGDHEVQAMRYSTASQGMMAIDQAPRADTAHPSLAGQLELNPRTIRRDIEFMRDRLDAPIAFGPRQRGFGRRTAVEDSNLACMQFTRIVAAMRWHCNPPFSDALCPKPGFIGIVAA
jgi:hypothetical protein